MSPKLLPRLHLACSIPLHAIWSPQLGSQLPEVYQRSCKGRILGKIHFYNRFTPQAAVLQIPLRDALREPLRKVTTTLRLTDKHAKAFNELKQELASVTLLAHLHPDAPLSIVVWYNSYYLAYKNPWVSFLND